LALDAGNGRIRWRARTGARILGAPVPAGGLVYATSLDRSVYAVDARSGAVRWRFRPGPTLGDPAVQHGVVCVGGDDGGFYGLDASTGSLRWRYRTGERTAALPAAEGRLFYVPTSTGVSAVEVGSGRVTWRFAVTRVADPLVRGTAGAGDLFVAAGGVYFGVGHGQQTLYAVDAATGGRRWTYPVGADTGRPLRIGGSVFAGDAHGDLYALDAASGTLRWQFQGSGVITGTPAVAGRNVVVASGAFGDGHVYAVDTGTGVAAWSYLIHGGIESSPAADGDNVYVSGKDGYVYALTGTTGTAVATPSRS
jgi:outer membrane protein assembly factor BamB